jgi:hypothetical protein
VSHDLSISGILRLIETHPGLPPLSTVKPPCLQAARGRFSAGEFCGAQGAANDSGISSVRISPAVVTCFSIVRGLTANAAAISS